MTIAPATNPLVRRLETLLGSGKAAQALNEARGYLEIKVGGISQQLFRRCLLKAAEEKVARDSFREANSLLDELERLDRDNPETILRVAELRADLGDYSRALSLTDGLPDPACRQRILGRLADRAMQQGSSGRVMLPQELHPSFEAMRKAFAEYEAGRDDSARERLGAVGLNSPFLDWKMLLRGLMARAAGDGTRAVENWSRLDPERLPARLAAPFRQQFDPSYLQTLSADRQQQAVKLGKELGGDLAAKLEKIRQQLVRTGSLATSLQLAESILPQLKKISPDLVRSLGNVFYWTLAGCGGAPSDLDRFLRVFGPPEDDPGLHRLKALAMEHVDMPGTAYEQWASYESWIARTPARWSRDQGARARAIILTRMGGLVRGGGRSRADDLAQILSAFTGGRVNKPGAGQEADARSAAACFRQAHELAPDWEEPALALFEELDGKTAERAALLRELRLKFPTNLRLLQVEMDDLIASKNLESSLECARQALRINPLDRNHQRTFVILNLCMARKRISQKKYEEAMAAIREVEQIGLPRMVPAVLSLGVVNLLHQGEMAGARQLREKLDAMPGQRLATAYRLAVQGSQVKLKRTILKPMQEDLERELQNGTPTGEELVELLIALTQYQSEPVPYRGIKAHETRIMALTLQVCQDSRVSEEHMSTIGVALYYASAWKNLKAFNQIFTERFQANPVAWFLYVEHALCSRKSARLKSRVGECFAWVWNNVHRDPTEKYSFLKPLLQERLETTPVLHEWMSDH